jgi:hypothetical protein
MYLKRLNKAMLAELIEEVGLSVVKVWLLDDFEVKQSAEFYDGAWVAISLRQPRSPSTGLEPKQAAGRTGLFPDGDCVIVIGSKVTPSGAEAIGRLRH